jgi:putative ABC transport system permease protein
MTWSLLQDLAFSIRALRKRPGFTVLAVLTVALGISMNTTIFAVVHDVLWKPLPYADSQRLVLLNESSRSGLLNCSYPNAVDWRQRSGSFEEIALFRGFPSVTMRLPGSAEVIATGYANPNLFDLFKLQPAMGRVFTASEDTAGGEPVGVITDRAWERFFGRDPSVVGRHVRIRLSFAGTSADSMVIAGVLPPGFRFSNIDLWLPLNRFWGRIDADRGNHWFLGLGKLKSGVTLEQARAELNGISRGLEQQYPATNTEVRGVAVPLAERMTGRVRTPLLLLLGAVTFVWLIACGNVVHLVLTRTIGRNREIAVRLALGASRGRMAQLLLADSLCIALLGGAMGALFAWWGVGWAVAYQPGVLPRAQGIHMNQSAALYAVFITALTFLTLGLVPLWRAFRAKLSGGLQEVGRVTERGRQRLGWLMIAGELAMATLLLAGAGLMIQTLRNLGQVSLGYKPEGVMAVDLSIPVFKFEKGGKLNGEQLAAFTRTIQEESRSIPGFISAAMAGNFQVGGNGMTPPVTIPGRANSGTPLMVPTTVVTPEFFDTLRIPLHLGRIFWTRGVREVVVNEEFARRFFPDVDPIGKKIDQGGTRTIVGVVGNTRLQGPLPVTQPEVYWAGDGEWDGPTLLVRVAGHPESVAAGLRDRLRQMEPDMRVGVVEFLLATESARTAVQRFTRGLLLVFAALAVVLAALGVYGVASYGVAQRTHEIGVRMALGASRGHVARLILGQTLAASIAGALAGAAGGVALARFLGSQLYEVRAHEPWIYGAVMALMAAVTLIAAALPVVRASRIDPAICLRTE